jgi:hypothetical protein
MKDYADKSEYHRGPMAEYKPTAELAIMTDDGRRYVYYDCARCGELTSRMILVDGLCPLCHSQIEVITLEAPK